ncbi:hypothetical protein BIV25_33195 [Streptomyces sp. MUSC 14]|nr:hypothetical protein BIV25_33195 [Streptomyces sp. MUSC 14]
MGVQRQSGVRQAGQAPPQHLARRHEEGMRRRAEEELAPRPRLGSRGRFRAAPRHRLGAEAHQACADAVFGDVAVGGGVGGGKAGSPVPAG